MVDKLKNWINNYYSVFLLLVVWEIVAMSGIFPERLFPSMTLIIQNIFELASSGVLWGDLGATLYRLFIGFALAAVIGVFLGIYMSKHPFFDGLMQPIFSIGYPIPRVALYPIVVFVIGLGSGSKIFLIFLECLFPIVISTYFGAKRVNNVYLWSGQNMGASSKEMFWKITLPATMPSIFTGFRIAIPLAFVVAVLTEMITSTEGLGNLLTFMEASLRQDQVLAVVTVISIVGFIIDRIVGIVRKKYVHWG
ncbi:ABC transporter permease [Salicibibacter cibarius]|uniref:ABC transporter permease n=1 Tax=Salicibibacter cibarius TaxID=2743000 RepID=A0A7T6YZZ9_9BACI|nr:ABC transporter permease [Salicibibacter cibarius]QQK74443.1 ABC transporter permease [Salicibibacter cibarius]